jgi:16S rRNA processing protein RimM
VAVGRVLRPWGIAGYLKVLPLTDFPDRFTPGNRVWLRGRQHTIQRARWQKGHVYLRLDGIDDAAEAEQLRGALLEVPEEELRPLPPGEYYHFQIVGLAVYSTEGECLGEVKEILTTGGNDVYVVRDDGREILVPAIDDVVKDIDLDAGRMTVELMEGMR